MVDREGVGGIGRERGGGETGRERERGRDRQREKGREADTEKEADRERENLPVAVQYKKETHATTKC